MLGLSWSMFVKGATGLHDLLHVTLKCEWAQAWFNFCCQCFSNCNVQAPFPCQHNRQVYYKYHEFLFKKEYVYWVVILIVLLVNHWDMVMSFVVIELDYGWLRHLYPLLSVNPFGAKPEYSKQHDDETFSELLAICAGNSPGNFWH